MVRITMVAAVAIALAFAANWTYQVVRKPSELFFPVSGRLNKTPSQTWQTYQRLFRRHSTDIAAPEFLAALAQVEAMGNPVARTYWRWSWSSQPFEIYRPASSSVGMYQMTDGTFAQARRLCIHNHELVHQGRWYELRSCWFNGLYTRVIPGHAIELTAAHLHYQVERILERHPGTRLSAAQKRDLAAVIHLCGATGATRYLRAEFPSGWRCGSHDLDAYLTRVRSMTLLFTRLSGESG